MKRNLAVLCGVAVLILPTVAGHPNAASEDRGQWVRFFVTSHGEYFPIRMKGTGDGWA